jgi:Spy/CpxP family protein refolding chaperone
MTQGDEPQAEARREGRMVLPEAAKAQTPLEDSRMTYRRFTVLACTVLVLAGGRLLRACEEKGAAPEARHHRLDALAAKLGLSDQQKEEIQKIHADFARQAAPLREQLGALHHDKREAMSKVLTEEQRARAKEVLKAEWETRWQATAARLNLTDEQKQRVEAIRREYAKQFEDLAGQKGEKQRDQFRALRHKQYQAIGRELTDEQRAKLGEIVRQEFRQRRDPAARMAFWKSVGEKLGVSPEQKEQFQKLHAAYAAKAEKPAAQLRELRRQEHAAVAKVLTEEQRARLQELRQDRGKGKPAVDGKE